MLNGTNYELANIAQKVLKFFVMLTAYTSQHQFHIL